VGPGHLISGTPKKQDIETLRKMNTVDSIGMHKAAELVHTAAALGDTPSQKAV